MWLLLEANVTFYLFSKIMRFPPRLHTLYTPPHSSFYQSFSDYLDNRLQIIYKDLKVTKESGCTQSDMKKDVLVRNTTMDFIKFLYCFVAKKGKRYPLYVWLKAQIQIFRCITLYLFVRRIFFTVLMLQKLLILLFKFSTIFRIFRDPGSPRSPLFSFLHIICHMKVP
jgi:hypothetical protein